MEVLGALLLAQIYTPIPAFVGGVSFAGVALAARGEDKQRLVVRASIALAFASVVLFFLGYSGKVILDPNFGGGSSFMLSPPSGAPTTRAQTTLNFLVPASALLLAAELFLTERTGLRVLAWILFVLAAATAVIVVVAGFVK